MSFERLLKPRSIAVFGGAHAQELIRQNDRMVWRASALDGPLFRGHLQCQSG